MVQRYEYHYGKYQKDLSEIDFDEIKDKISTIEQTTSADIDIDCELDIKDITRKSLRKNYAELKF